MSGQEQLIRGLNTRWVRVLALHMIYSPISRLLEGVAHLARTMATHIKDSQPELKLTDRDVDCVELAGLCHDLGHGPWSHVWDGSFIPTAL